ncbi:MAG: hypothetical protein H7Y06_01845 [Opitutaceae bacterium]|nr:hypothetical protein [Opitutaceae bacterium]
MNTSGPRTRASSSMPSIELSVLSQSKIKSFGADTPPTKTVASDPRNDFRAFPANVRNTNIGLKDA